MAITLTDYITIMAFGLSIVSLVIVILYVRLARGGNLRHDSDDIGLEVSAIVSEFNQRMKKLEVRLVDLNVKLEILSVRVGRSHVQIPGAMVGDLVAERDTADSDMGTDVVGGLTRPQLRSNIKREIRSEKGRNTEVEVMRIVYEGGGRVSAREVQVRIGLTREHTARMLNRLFQDGLLERDVSARPFSYSVTNKGRELIGV